MKRRPDIEAAVMATPFFGGYSGMSAFGGTHVDFVTEAGVKAPILALTAHAMAAGAHVFLRDRVS